MILIRALAKFGLRTKTTETVRAICWFRSERKLNNVKRFDRSINWVKNHVSTEGGIQVSSVNSKMYPEVTGYFIPTLLNWGERDLAFSFGAALLPVQQDDGSFLDPSGKAKCVFDTGQIIRGLHELALISSNQDYTLALTKSVKWIASTIDKSGKVSAPDVEVWGGIIPMGILLYSLEPAFRAAAYLGLTSEEKQIKAGIQKLLQDDQLTDFQSVSHFHASVLEALVDLGENSRAEQSLEWILGKSDFRGWVPGIPGKKWVCSTAMFQYAVVCYKLGLNSEGDKLFQAAAKLQNTSGGWYGSYGFFAKILAPAGRILPKFSMYFPRTEIPWVNKYFLDSLKLRLEASFELMSPIFSDHISANDGRVIYILDEIEKVKPNILLDLGCGKGRYIKHIAKNNPGIEIHACDMSTNVTADIMPPVKVAKGSLVKTAYQSESFDFIIAVEALEHSLNINAAILEMDRLLLPGGTIVIIDKNINKLGRLKLPDWERCFNATELAQKLKSMNYAVEIDLNLEYEGRKDGLFFGLSGRKSD
jgi:malonyl-CoA O-methyltransferase